MTEQQTNTTTDLVAGEGPLVKVENLKVYFPITSGILQRRVGDIKAVNDVSFTVMRGETLGLVGESGSGTTTVGRSILTLQKPTAGRVSFNGVDLTALSSRGMHPYRRHIQVIFQDPYSSLDPRATAGGIISEPLRVHKLTASGSETKERVEELLSIVGLHPNMAGRYPHEFSGGQRQRIGVARALALEPDFIVADEPISALDVSIQAQLINLLQDLQERLGLTYLFIAHDMAVVRHIANRVAVMYLGRIMEIASSEQVYTNPKHPYTQALLSAVPRPDPVVEAARKRVPLIGTIPSPANPPSGCVFHTRCPVAIDECKTTIPEMKQIEDGHQAACLLA